MCKMHGYRLRTRATVRSCIPGEHLITALSLDICKYSYHKCLEEKLYLFWTYAELLLAVVPCKIKHSLYLHSVCVKLGIKNNLEKIKSTREDVGGTCKCSNVMLLYVKCWASEDLGIYNGSWNQYTMDVRGWMSSCLAFPRSLYFGI